MANIPINDLEVAISLDGSEYFSVVQSGTTKRAQTGLLMGGDDDGGNQSANTVFAGPTSGSPAAPTFRALVPADFPAPFVPNVSDGSALGSTSKMWSDLFLASGGVINWNNGDVTITHSTDALAFAGADISITARAVGATPLTINQFSTSQTAPLLDLAGGNVAGTDMQGVLWERPASVSVNTIPYRFIFNQNYFAGGGPSGANYTNEVIAWGWNLSPIVGNRLVAGTGAVYDAMEAKYYPGSGTQYQWERHFEAITATNTNQRYLTFSGLFDGSAINGQAALNIFNWCDLNTNQILKITLDSTTTSTWRFTDDASITFGKNNTGGIYQRNAADSADVRLMYLDSSNQLRLGGSALVASLNYVSAASCSISASSPTNGSTILALINSGTVNTLSALTCYTAANGQLLIDLYNTGTGDAVYRAMKDSSSTRDPIVLFSILTANNSFAVGIDNSDSDKFKISNNDTLGTNDWFTMTTAGVITMGVTSVSPTSSDGAALGTASLMWSDLFLASGAVINFNNGNYTLTHSAGNLTAAGGPFTAPSFIPSSSTVPSNGLYLPASNTLGWAVNTTATTQLTASALSPVTSDAVALGTTSLMWSDLFLASGAVVNFNAGNYTLTHSAGALAANGTFSATGVSGTLTLASRTATATPAAASAVAGFTMGSANVGIYWGTGDPNTALTAARGSLFCRTDGGAGTTLYTNTDGSTAWSAV